MANIKLTMDDSTKSDPELPPHLCFQLQPLTLTLEQSQGVCLHIIEVTDHEQAKGPIRSGVVNTEGSGFPSRTVSCGVCLLDHRSCLGHLLHLGLF